jgi:hypothetical protein
MVIVNDVVRIEFYKFVKLLKKLNLISKSELIRWSVTWDNNVASISRMDYE